MTIQTEDEVFKPTPCRELARLLRDLAARIYDGHLDDHSIMSLDGLKVGRVDFVEEE
jgi:hypothetical protein